MSKTVKFRDFHAEIVPFFAVKMGRKTGNLEELKISVLEPAIKKYLPLYVKILDNSKSGLFFMLNRGQIKILEKSRNVSPHILRIFSFVICPFELIFQLYSKYLPVLLTSNWKAKIIQL